MRFLRFILVPLLGSSALFAGYPTPPTVGFHHAVLVYHRGTRSMEDLTPYVAEIENGVPRAWLFDAFLFLALRAPSGRRTTDGETVREDWQALLDTWFSPKRDLTALDRAIDRAAKRLGKPSTPRRIILAIPRPNPRVHNFGDVTGSGRSEDLGTAAGTRTVLAWYVHEAVRRFRSAHFKHLDLWGFYWIHETIPPGDERLVHAAAAEVHSAGCRLLWIPWFRARGWDRWRELGIDTAILQPNYAFFSKHRGRIRRDRLALAAQLASTHGMGVELELSMAADDPRSSSYFLRYLADGASDRFGYQTGTTAWYLGRDNLERLFFSDKPWQRSLYRAIAQFVHGKKVPDPDPRPEWRVGKRAVPGLNDGRWAVPQKGVSSAVAEFANPGWVRAVDIALPETRGIPPLRWCGLTAVDTKETTASPWRTAGWEFGPGNGTADTPWRSMTVPVRQVATAVRVRFLDGDGTTPVAPARGVCELRIDATPADTAILRHRAFACSYRIEPDSATAQYGDSGRELTDGVIPGNGYVSGRTVGWHGKDVAITFDFGRVVSVQRVEAVVEGGGHAGIRWPVNPVLLLQKERTCPPIRTGVGPIPSGLTFTPGQAVRIDRQRAPDAATGRIVFSPTSPELAEFATVFLRAVGWLMISEVRIFVNDENIAPATRYTLRPLPDRNERYADDGKRLTDGRIARRFSPPDLTGWRGSAPRTILIDLGFSQSVRRVTVCGLGGGKYGIRAPAEIAAALSVDRIAWQSIGTAHRPTDPDKSKHIAPVAYAVDLPSSVTARWVRLSIRSSTGWNLLSEIVIE